MSVPAHYWEGMRSREIGEVLELPTSTVTSRLARARVALRRKFDSISEETGLATTASSACDPEAWARSLADNVE